MEREYRNALLLGLLLIALLLSTGLNVYFLQQSTGQPINYELEAGGGPATATEIELLRTRAELVDCQRLRAQRDTLGPASPPTDSPASRQAQAAL